MKKGLSRRDFLKVSAAGALGVATMGAQVAMAQEDEKKEAAVKPVSYTHLDVYKRQPSYGTAERTTCAPRIHNASKTSLACSPLLREDCHAWLMFRTTERCV